MSHHNTNLNIAVIGAGISGLSAAWLLSRKHNVMVFEADEHFGGHANTVIAKTPDADVAVDTGFIVCNDRNYPNFLALMDHLKVSYVPTEMSFGISIGRGDFEYAGTDSLSPLFAQKSNILRPRFWKMVKSLLRFYKETSSMDPTHTDEITLKDYLAKHNYSDAFIRDHILPMAASVWSTPSEKVGDFPLTSFLRFCQNHGLLQVSDRPQWYTIEGGSQQYVKALMADTNAKFLSSSPIDSIQRKNGKVVVKPKGQDAHAFDKILIATHANTALSMLDDADPLESSLLGAFNYAKNTAVLHSDESFMPKRKKAWSSWNYLQEDETDRSKLSVTYWMNKLQPLTGDTPLFVTLNPARDIDASKTYYTKEYDHPIFDLDTLSAQKQLSNLMGYRDVYYAGAHFGYGFHEDGIQSGLYAAEMMGSLARPWIRPDMNGRIITLGKYDDNTMIEAAE